MFETAHGRPTILLETASETLVSPVPPGCDTASVETQVQNPQVGSKGG